MPIHKQKKTAALAIVAGLFVATAAVAQDQPVSQGGWAVVNEAGRLVNGLNVKRVNHAATGVYHVGFNQDISACATTASIRGETGKILPGYIVVSNMHTDKVAVTTYSAATALPTDLNFNMVVSC